MASPSPHIKLMALIAKAQADDELHARQASDHTERHERLQEKKRVERAAAVRTAAITNPPG